MPLELPRSAVLVSYHQNCQGWQFYGHFGLWPKSAIRTAKVGSLLTKRSHGWKVPSELPRSAVLRRLKKCHQNCHREAVLMALHQNWLCSGRNVPLELPRSAVLWPNHYYGRKVPLELPRSAVLWSDHRTAKGGSSNPQKKVWIELPRLAVLMALFRTANSGSCSQVSYSKLKLEKLFKISLDV